MSDPVTYTAVLPASDETVLVAWAVLAADPRRRGTRRGRRALGCYRQAVLILRWFLDGTRLAQLAGDNRITPLHGRPVSARGHRRPGRAGAARRAAGRARRRSHPRAGGRHADPYRPLPCARPYGPTARGGGWTCGGRASTPLMAATSRSSPPRTAGRCGFRACGRDESTTPARCAPMPRC